MQSSNYNKLEEKKETEKKAKQSKMQNEKQRAKQSMHTINCTEQKQIN